LGDADITHAADGRDDEHRWQVEQGATSHQFAIDDGERRTGQLRGQRQVEGTQKCVQVTRPAHRDRRGREQVFQHQAPADEPGHAFTQGGVGVGVRAAGHWKHGGELGVAKARKCTGNAGQHEAEHDRRSGVLGCRLAGEHENAGADHRAHAQQQQLGGRQRPAQVRFAFRVAFHRLPGIDVTRRLDRLGHQQILEHGNPNDWRAARAVLRHLARLRSGKRPVTLPQSRKHRQADFVGPVEPS